MFCISYRNVFRVLEDRPISRRVLADRKQRKIVSSNRTIGVGRVGEEKFQQRSYTKMATDMNMFVWIDNCRSSSVDRCEHESRELSLRTPVCYTTSCFRHGRVVALHRSRVSAPRQLRVLPVSLLAFSLVRLFPGRSLSVSPFSLA